MTAYEHNNLPDELNATALPNDLFDEARTAFIQAMESGLVDAIEIKAVHVFDRKGWMETNSFLGHQNTNYRSENDDVILQLTLRIPNPRTIGCGKYLSATAALEKRAADYELNAQRARLESEIAQAEAEAVRAATVAREKRAVLESLREK